MLQIKSIPIKALHISSPLIVLILAFLAYIFDEELTNFLIYNHELITQAQYWRIVSGHFLHTNSNHFMLNAAAIILLWALHGQYYNPINYPLIFLINAIVCSLGMYWFSPDITLYVGLSGVLHGFFVWGALMDIKQQEKTGYLLLIGVILKVAHEQLYGVSSDIESFIDATVAIDAHLFGGVGGLLAFLLFNCTKLNNLQK